MAVANLVGAWTIGAIVFTASGQFRVKPYIQNPSPDSVTVRWLSNDDEMGTLTIAQRHFSSLPVATQLDANSFLHSVRVDGLEAVSLYNYSVKQGSANIDGSFLTPPKRGHVGRDRVRLFFLADTETEPGSTGHRVTWRESVGSNRPPRGDERYLTDQTEGLRGHLDIISARARESIMGRNPALISVVGDLVETGNEQSHWDEFWEHMGTVSPYVPLIAAIGNHEAYDARLGYTADTSLAARSKFFTYLEHPSKKSYYRLDFGIVTILTLDSTNGGTHGGEDDTNHLLGADARHIPDYAPGSEQHDWLQRELELASSQGQIVFVQFHHAPYSSGVHGKPPRKGGVAEEEEDEQSGRPMRLLSPLFEEYKVAAVFSGHDEMYEHSVVNGIHYYCVGSGGDGLRGTYTANPFAVYLAHRDSPERWEGERLVEGGKHYSHVEVTVTRESECEFRVLIVPAYSFPVEVSGDRVGWERREYPDSLEQRIRTQCREL